MKKAVRPPTVRIGHVALKSLDMERAVFTTVLVLSNPNPYPIRTKGMSCALFVDSTNKPLAALWRDEPISLRPRGTNVLALDIELRFDAVSLRTLKSTNIPYLIAGEVVVDLGLGSVRFPFEHRGSVPTPKTPVMRLVRLGLVSFSFTGLKAGFEMYVSVSNRNPYNLPLKDLKMDLNLNGRPVLSSADTEEEELDIGPYVSRTVKLAFGVDLSGIKDLALALAQGRKLDFGLQGSYKPDLAYPPDLPYDFMEKGLIPVIK